MPRVTRASEAALERITWDDCAVEVKHTAAISDPADLERLEL